MKNIFKLIKHILCGPHDMVLENTELNDDGSVLETYVCSVCGRVEYRNKKE